MDLKPSENNKEVYQTNKRTTKKVIEIEAPKRASHNVYGVKCIATEKCIVTGVLNM